MIASIRHAKAHLSELVGAAIRGEDILITSHGRAVARLSAVGNTTESLDPKVVMQALATEGAIDAPEKPRRRRRLPPLIRLKGDVTMAQTISEMRR